MKTMILSTVLLFSFILSDAQNVEAGKKMFNYQKYASANIVLQQAIKNNQNDAQAYLWQVFVLNELNSMQEAKKLIAKVPAGIQNNPYIKIAKGFIALYDKDSAAAKVYFNEAINDDRKREPAQHIAVAIANVESANGDNLFAINLLEDAIKKEKKDADIYIIEGDAYRKLLDASNAFTAYNNALDIDKNNALANYKLGKLFQSQENKDMYLMYYNKAIAIDPQFAPAYYQLFYIFYSYSPKIAKEYLDLYMANSDKSISNDYLKVDMLYLLKNYTEAIKIANQIAQTDADKTKPRIYKLLAYCYDAQNDSLKTEIQLKKYFSADKDTADYAAADYYLMGKVLEKKGQINDAINWYQKAFSNENSEAIEINDAAKLSSLYQKQKDYPNQAYWAEKYYNLKPDANNVDLFNWGIAAYNAKQYMAADSVFALYQNKFPDQAFGYYWRARTNEAMDTAMESGIAIPHYEHLIEVASKELNNALYKKWVIEAYGYIAAFEANTNKHYDTALTYYDRILTLDSTNEDALKYKEVLEKMIKNQHLIENHQAVSNKKEEKKAGN